MQNLEEKQYLDLMKRILEEGIDCEDRTGVGIRKLVGQTMRFNLQESFPLLTTKKVFFRGIAEELFWFLNGNTNVNSLKEKKVNFWNANYEDFRKRIDKKIQKLINEQYSSEFFSYEKREELNNLQSIKNGDLGKIYGYQWRNFGGTGFDQISHVIEQIKNNPNSRRHIVSAWNPSDAFDDLKCGLPPCHFTFQFIVLGDKLSLCLTARSQDVFLGTTFNISSYALLLVLIAHVCNLKPYELVWYGNDCHIYSNHFEAVKEQLKREPYEFPKLKINQDKKNIFDFNYDDLELIGYKYHPLIKADMAI